MPDQIYTPGPDTAPLLYTIPGSQQMVPRAFQALFDGTGASGDYVPTVVLRSQAGHVIARAILDETVAAGASAEVSWFPRLRHAIASAATGVELCIGATAEPYNIPATGGSPNAATTWASVTPDTGTFVWPSSGDSTKIGLTKAGVYLCAYCPTPVATWPAPASGFITFILQCNTFGVGFLNSSPFLNTTTSALYAGSAQRELIVFACFNLPSADEIQLFAGNSTVGNFATQITTLFIARMGAAIPGEPI